MNGDFYSSIKAQLTAEVPELKTIRLFNDQFNHSNDQRDEAPFLYPCVFIQFIDIQTADLTQNVQQANFTTRIHFGFENYEDEDVTMFALKAKIYKALQHFGANFFGPMVRVSEEQDHEHNNIYIYLIDFQTSGKDYDACVEKPEATITTLTVNADLDIDNDIIRTGDGTI